MPTEIVKDDQFLDTVRSFIFVDRKRHGLSGTNSIINTIANQPGVVDSRSMKRTVQVNVKMTDEDFSALKRAADAKWPDAVMTNSGIVLALARIAAREILGHRKKR